MYQSSPTPVLATLIYSRSAASDLAMSRPFIFTQERRMDTSPYYSWPLSCSIFCLQLVIFIQNICLWFACFVCPKMFSLFRRNKCVVFFKTDNAAKHSCLKGNCNWTNGLSHKLWPYCCGYTISLLLIWIAFYLWMSPFCFLYSLNSLWSLFPMHDAVWWTGSLSKVYPAFALWCWDRLQPPTPPPRPLTG